MKAARRKFATIISALLGPSGQLTVRARSHAVKAINLARDSATMGMIATAK